MASSLISLAFERYHANTLCEEKAKVTSGMRFFFRALFRGPNQHKHKRDGLSIITHLVALLCFDLPVAPCSLIIIIIVSSIMI